MANIGDRVGAILSANDQVVNLLGYGVYVGDEVHPGLGRPNPKIVLDNGDVVWGCECWWGPEGRIRQAIGDRKVEEVRIREVRGENDA